MTSCEEEGLNEEELIESFAQSLNLSVQVTEVVFDEDEGVFLETAIADASVSTSTESGDQMVMTDAGGIAFFSDVAEGTYTINVEKEGFTKASQSVSVVASGRSNTISLSIELISLVDPAIIRGTLIVQTDLTTVATETVGNVRIIAFDPFENDDDSFITETFTASDGSFELIIPISKTTFETFRRTDVELSIPDLILDQQIAIKDDMGNVSTQTASGTVFKPYEAAVAVPNTANIIAEVAAPDFFGGRQSYIESLTVSSGVITDLVLSNTGFGYSNGSPISVTVNSPDGGSGADIELSAVFDSNAGCSSATRNIIDNFTINNGGTGYPDYVPNQNVTTTHPTGFSFDNQGCDPLNDNFQVRPGEIYDLILNYGTGTIRGTIQ